MADLIDIYLTRFERRLSVRLPKPVVDEHVREISGHLRDNVRSRVIGGEPSESAQVAALRDMGNDRLVADSLIRAHSGIEKLSVWRLAWLPALVLLLYGLIPISFFDMKVVPEWLLDFTDRLPYLFFLLFGFACWRSRKLLWRPIVAIMGVVFLASFVDLFLIGPYGITQHSQSMRRDLIRTAEQPIPQFRNELSLINDTSKASPYPSELNTKEGYLAPDVSKYQAFKRGAPSSNTMTVSAMIFGKAFLEPVQTEAHARARWKLAGPPYASDLVAAISFQQSQAASWKSANLNWSVLKNVTLASGLLMGIALATILSMNLLLLGIEHLHRRIVAELWRPERLASFKGR